MSIWWANESNGIKVGLRGAMHTGYTCYESLAYRKSTSYLN